VSVQDSSLSPSARESAPWDGPLFTPDDVASLLKVSKKTVFRLRAGGLLPPPVELSTNLIRWRADDIHRFIAELKVRKPRRRPCTADR
jgi:predicted DNA-binding transcriptional regulator AlpA